MPALGRRLFDIGTTTHPTHPLREAVTGLLAARPHRKGTLASKISNPVAVQRDILAERLKLTMRTDPELKPFLESAHARGYRFVKPSLGKDFISLTPTVKSGAGTNKALGAVRSLRLRAFEKSGRGVPINTLLNKHEFRERKLNNADRRRGIPVRAVPRK